MATANREASAAKLNIIIKGSSLSSSSSVCASQSIAEGAEVKPGTVINLVFAQSKTEHKD